MFVRTEECRGGSWTLCDHVSFSDFNFADLHKQQSSIELCSLVAAVFRLTAMVKIAFGSIAVTEHLLHVYLRMIHYWSEITIDLDCAPEIASINIT